ncbi:MAG: NUDIX domain-containing protein [Rhodocyclaceae bacterium]|jgi:NADH pyrophosphatase NudC (nudix superfamily)
MKGAHFCRACGAPLETLPLAGRLRRVCAAGCGHVEWGNPLPVVAALVEREGCMVLARNHAWAEGAFGLITGFLEAGESPEAAVAREVKEELNLDVQSVALIGVYPFERNNEVIIAYHVQADGEVVLNEELAEFRLIPPEKLRPWEFGTGLAVRDWLARRE